ncbi:MAG TPA: sterol desaturase family protein [Chitinophagales bacterium]
MESLIVLAIPFFFLLIGIELLYFYIKKQKGFYRLNDFINNISLGIGNQVIATLLKVLSFGIYIWIYSRFAQFHLPNTWWMGIITFVAFDFIYYWAHRFGHTISFFWGAHGVHHQSEDYNLSVALRQSWFQNLFSTPLFLPLAIIGISPLMLGIVGGINTLYQFWIHTEAIRKMPRWFEFLFNTPSHHRVHHAINPQYIDKNHAGTLMVWDRLFGTYAEEVETREIRYGITKQLSSWSPAWANFEFYAKYLRNLKFEKTFFAKFKMIFWQPPGWNAQKQVEESVPEPNYERQKYNANTNIFNRVYCFAHFIIILAGTLAYLKNFNELSWTYKLLFAGILLFSIEIIGRIFENKVWAVYGEYIRLSLVMFGLNWFYYFNYPSWILVMIISSSIAVAASFALYTYFLKTRLQKI